MLELTSNQIVPVNASGHESSLLFASLVHQELSKVHSAATTHDVCITYADLERRQQNLMPLQRGAEIMCFLCQWVERQYCVQ